MKNVELELRAQQMSLLLVQYIVQRPSVQVSNAGVRLEYRNNVVEHSCQWPHEDAKPMAKPERPEPTQGAGPTSVVRRRT